MGFFSHLRARRFMQRSSVGGALDPELAQMAREQSSRQAVAARAKLYAAVDHARACERYGAERDRIWSIALLDSAVHGYADVMRRFDADFD